VACEKVKPTYLYGSFVPVILCTFGENVKWHIHRLIYSYVWKFCEKCVILCAFGKNVKWHIHQLLYSYGISGRELKEQKRWNLFCAVATTFISSTYVAVTNFSKSAFLCGQLPHLSLLIFPNHCGHSWLYI
jgi:hypothetical protein